MAPGGNQAEVEAGKALQEMTKKELLGELDSLGGSPENWRGNKADLLEEVARLAAEPGVLTDDSADTGEEGATAEEAEARTPVVNCSHPKQATKGDWRVCSDCGEFLGSL